MAERTPLINVSCIRIQICDNGLHGCGRIIENRYDTAQICDYRRHPDYQPPADRPLQDAPYMRCAVVAEVAMNGLQSDAFASSREQEGEREYVKRRAREIVAADPKLSLSDAEEQAVGELDRRAETDEPSREQP